MTCCEILRCAQDDTAAGSLTLAAVRPSPAHQSLVQFRCDFSGSFVPRVTCKADQRHRRLPYFLLPEHPAEDQRHANRGIAFDHELRS